jgi:hypothetical protein
VLNLTNLADYQFILGCHLEATTLANLRKLMKETLNLCYHFNNAEHKRTREFYLVRLNMSLVQLVNINALYREDKRHLWQPMFAWKNIPPTS